MKQKIMGLIDFVETIPEQYRDRTFDRLFDLIVLGSTKIKESKEEDENLLEDAGVPKEVRTFINRHEIAAQDFIWLFTIAEGIVNRRYNYDVKESKNRPDLHLELGCLEAMASAMAGGRFEFTRQALQNRLGDEHDSKDFNKSLKARSEYFVDSRTDPVALSNKGLTKLAEVIKRLIKNEQK